jgi:RNA polymerase sigma-70 factor (ECF subfamily)
MERATAPVVEARGDPSPTFDEFVRTSRDPIARSITRAVGDRRLALAATEITVVALSPDDRGFADFYRRTRPSIGRALALAIGDVDLAADATDEAFTRAYERWRKVSALERPEAWIYRVGLNWATSVRRRRRRSNHRQYEADAADPPAAAEAAVRAGLASLDGKHRAVIVCRHLLGWSVAETAAALGVREGTVKSRLHRATRTLQSVLHHLDPKDLR